MSIDQSELSLSSDTASALLFSGGVGAMGSGLEEVVMEMDKLSVEETRDLLVSLLFVLKHLDTREWEESGKTDRALRMYGDLVVCIPVLMMFYK